jgi:hypothetical protein
MFVLQLIYIFVYALVGFVSHCGYTFENVYSKLVTMKLKLPWIILKGVKMTVILC